MSPSQRDSRRPHEAAKVGFDEEFGGARQLPHSGDGARVIVAQKRREDDLVICNLRLDAEHALG